MKCFKGARPWCCSRVLWFTEMGLLGAADNTVTQGCKTATESPSCRSTKRLPAMHWHVGNVPAGPAIRPRKLQPRTQWPYALPDC